MMIKIRSLFLIVLALSTFVVHAGVCTPEEIEKVNALSTEPEFAQNVAQQVLGLSYQKLAYAHHKYNGQKSDLSGLKSSIKEFMGGNTINGLSADDVMAKLSEYHKRVNSPTAYQLAKEDKEYVKALSIYSRTFKGVEKNYQIKNYEENALMNFGHTVKRGEKSYTQKETWRTAIGNIARHFKHRRFKDADGNLVTPDMNATKDKVSKFTTGISEAVKAYKEHLVEKADKIISEDCKNAILSSNDSVCKNEKSPLLGINQNTIDFYLNNILARLDEKVVPTRPEVGYAGAKAKVNSCKVVHNKEDDTYNIELNLDFENMPSGSKEWSLTLNDSISDKIQHEHDEQGLTKKVFNNVLNFNGLKIEDINENINFKFKSKFGNTMGSLNGAGATSDGFNFDCKIPEQVKPKAMTPPTYKILTTSSNNGEEYTLSLKTIQKTTKSESNEEITEDVTIPSEIKASWSITNSLTCEAFKEEDSSQKTCVVKNVKTSSSATVSIDLGGEIGALTETIKFGNEPVFKIELKESAVEGKPLELKLSAKIIKEIASKPTQLTETDKKDIEWKCVGKCEGIPTSGVSINITSKLKHLGAKISACIKETEICETKTISFNLKGKLKIIKDGENKGDKKEVKLKLKEFDPSIKALLDKATFTWSCTVEKCDGTGKTHSLNRHKTKDKLVTVKTTMEGIELTDTYEISDLKVSSDSNDDDSDDGDDEDEESEEECTQDDAFSEKVCKPKGQTAPLPTKYMPPMSKPLILPPSQPYISPGFN